MSSYIQSSKLRAYTTITHAFFKGRKLDGSVTNHDVTKLVSADRLPLYHLKQVHSNLTYTVPLVSGEDIPRGDALVASQPSCLLCIETADCVPILMYEPQRHIICAAHAGWRGARYGILDSAISAMEKLGANRQTIVVAFGPSISVHNYQVDKNFKDLFLEESLHNNTFFKKDILQDKKYLFNLPGYCVNKLIELGIIKQNIDLSANVDTYGSEEFFSYRYFCHNEHSKYRTQYSMISHKPISHL